jgi:hypothetical protein
MGELRRRLRGAYVGGAGEWTREHVGRSITGEELAGVIASATPALVTDGTVRDLARNSVADRERSDCKPEPHVGQFQPVIRFVHGNEAGEDEEHRGNDEYRETKHLAPPSRTRVQRLAARLSDACAEALCCEPTSGAAGDRAVPCPAVSDEASGVRHLAAGPRLLRWLGPRRRAVPMAWGRRQVPPIAQAQRQAWQSSRRPST